jgi:hypothetical protein
MTTIKLYFFLLSLVSSFFFFTLASSYGHQLKERVSYHSCFFYHKVNEDSFIYSWQTQWELITKESYLLEGALFKSLIHLYRVFFINLLNNCKLMSEWFYILPYFMSTFKEQKKRKRKKKSRRDTLVK